MPRYSFVCTNGHQHDEVRAVDDRKRAGRCTECGDKTKRDFESEMRTISAIIPRNFTPTYYPAFGEHVESDAHLRHLQKTHGTCDMGADDFGSPPSHFDNKGYGQPPPEQPGPAPKWSADDTSGDAEIVGTGI